MTRKNLPREATPVDDAAILVPKESPKAQGAATYRATDATFADGVLTVAVKGEEPVTVPSGAAVYCNGVLNAPANVPAWLRFHQEETVRVDLVNEKRREAGREAVPPVPPVHFTLAETEDGVVARFDQRS